MRERPRVGDPHAVATVDAGLKHVRSKLPHLVAIDSFRGVAILIIIAGHVISLAGLNSDAFPEKVAVSLFKGGTALFVFISGFLFHYLLTKGFSYRQQYGNMHKPAWEWGGADLNLIQKMLSCLFFYSLFSRIEWLNHPVLKTLAIASFALFFLHPLVLKLLEKFTVREWFSTPYGPLPEVVLWVLWTLVVTMLSYGIAVTIRWLVPGQSRRVIGW